MSENLYTSQPRKLTTSYQPRPVISSERPKYRNPKIQPKKISQEPVSFDVGVPKKQNWGYQEEVKQVTPVSLHEVQVDRSLSAPPSIEEYEQPAPLSYSPTASPTVVGASVVALPNISQPFVQVFSGRIAVDPFIIRAVKSFFLDTSNNAKFKIKPTSALFTLMAVVLFSFGIYTNLHSLSVAHAIQKQAALESSQQTSGSAASSNTGTSNTASASVSETKPSAHAVAAYSVAPDKPKYITIPSLGVNARVIEVGVTKNNSVGAPSNTSDTAWFNQSAKPGQNGASFIDGHVLGPIHGGVFANLKNIQDGAQIIITMGDNTTYNYTVKKTAIISKDAIDMNSMLRSVDPAKQGLNLMTCTGTYITSQATYNNRFIVYAVRN